MDFRISAEKCSFRGKLKKAFLHFWQIFVIWSFVFCPLFSKHILGTQSITIIHALFQNTKYGYEHHHATNRSSSKTSENKLKTQKTSVVHAHCAGKTTSWLIKSQFWKSLPFDFTLHTAQFLEFNPHSETRCLWSICLMKLARKILQNLPYLWDKKFQIFLIHLDCRIPRLVCYRSIYSENMAYGELDNFIKYKPLKLCNVFCYIFCTLLLTYRAMCSLWSILLMLGVY